MRPLGDARRLPCQEPSASVEIGPDALAKTLHYHLRLYGHVQQHNCRHAQQLCEGHELGDLVRVETSDVDARVPHPCLRFVADCEKRSVCPP